MLLNEYQYQYHSNHSRFEIFVYILQGFGQLLFPRCCPNDESWALQKMLSKPLLARCAGGHTWGLNSHCFPVFRDGHQPNRRVVYTYYKDSLLQVR